MTPERWQRIEELFHAARERAAAERASFLAEACEGDASVLSEVEALLAHSGESLLDGGVTPAVAAAAPHAAGRHEERTLGPYVLGPLIGAGGMSEVYRARDTRLGRDVAVKILPEAAWGHGPDDTRRARFEREARILAQLAHPNIAAVYGVEEADDLRGIVLELVEGTTLQGRLGSGPLPAEEAIAIAHQVADALEAAHQKGIVHRDLKPANIQITPQGTVKVLDFGLARMDGPDVGAENGSGVLSTREGVVLGTVAYMSPEQARGLAVDKRTDIWAFGCVLFEMLTGARAFPGDTSADVIAAITRGEPDWTRLPAATPPGVRRLLRRCLARDREHRLRDIADARLELDDPADDAPRAWPDAPSAAPARTRIRAWAAAALSVVAVAAVLWAVAARPLPEPTGPLRLAIELPPGVSIALGRGSSVAVSPDGERIAFAGVADGRTRLYVRALSSAESVPLSGTDGAMNPFFSPDGRWLGFWADDQVKRVSVGGGAILPVAPASYHGATWGPGDTLFFTRIGARGLSRVKVDAGEAQPVTALDTNELHHSWPQVIGGGRALLHTAWNNSGFDGARILVRPITGGEPTVLVEGASHARVVRARGGSAYLVYARAEGVLAAPFDEETLRVAGAAVPVQHAIQTNLSGGAHFSVSDTGLLAYVQGTMNELDKTLVWVDPTGAATDIATITGLSFNYRLSPDGRRIVRPNTSGGDRDLWVDDLEGRGPPRRLTFGGVHNTPIWTPDGSRVIYASGVPRGNLFWKAADGSGAEERLSSSAHAQMPGSVSPDGGTLAYTQIAGDQQPPDIWLMSLREPREVRRFVSTPLADIRPTFSPDGRWLAYSSNVSGRFEVYVTSLPDGDRQIPVSNGGGYLPLWSRDGRELYYRTTSTESITGNVMAATFDADAPEPVRGTRPLFAAPYQGDGGVAPDGRFLYLQPTPQVSTARVIHVVVNWTDELAAIVQGR